MYRGSRFVVFAFWFVAFGMAIRHRDWIKANVPAGYGVYTEVVLLIGIIAGCWALLLPKIRAWRWQRLIAQGAATTIQTDQTAAEMRNLMRTLAKLYTDVNRVQQHVSERPPEPPEDPSESYEDMLAQIAYDNQRVLDEDLARGKPKRRRPRKPTTDERLAVMERTMAKIAEKLEQ